MHLEGVSELLFVEEALKFEILAGIFLGLLTESETPIASQQSLFEI